MRPGWWPSLHVSPGETGEAGQIRLQPFHYSGARAGQSGGKTAPRSRESVGAPAITMPIWGSVSTPPGTLLSHILVERVIIFHQSATSPAQSPGRDRGDQLYRSLTVSHAWRTQKRIFLASSLQEGLAWGTGWKPPLPGAEVWSGVIIRFATCKGKN